MNYKRITGHIVVTGAMLIITVVACRAQRVSEETGQDHWYTVSFAGGATWPSGKEGDNFNRGWGLQAGGGFLFADQRRVDDPGRKVLLGFTANYMYARLDATSKALGQITGGTTAPFPNAVSAHGSFSAVTIDLTARNLVHFHALGARGNVYASGGFGWLHRGVGITGPNTPTLLQPAAATLGTATSDSGVFDVGAGVNVSPRFLRGLMVYVEGRVYKGAAINSSTTLVPLSFGVRW